MIDKAVELFTYILPKTQKETSQKAEGGIKEVVAKILSVQPELVIKNVANLIPIIEFHGSRLHSVLITERICKLKELIKTLIWSHSLEPVEVS